LAGDGGGAVEELADGCEFAVVVAVKERSHLPDQRSEYLVLNGDDGVCGLHQHAPAVIGVL
jgi:hypothetical protein